MKSLRSVALFGALLLSIAGTLTAFEADPRVSALRFELERIIGTLPGRTASWGILAISMERGDTLFALNHDVPLAPASNQKLFTSAAALHLLGPEYRFSTFLLTDGKIEAGVLEGDLILYGTGDPSISDRLLDSSIAPFARFARELRARGIHTVRGDVVGDGTFFEGPTRRDSWNPADLNDWFTAPATALSFNENVVTLRIQPSAPGARPRVLTLPEGADLPLINGGWTTQSRTSTPLLLVRDDPDGPIEIRGDISRGQAEVWRRLTVSDPAGYAASVFSSVLEDHGIRVLGTSRHVTLREESQVSRPRVIAPAFRDGEEGAARTPALRTLAVHESPPLTELLSVVNKASHNLFADLLLLSIGRISGEGGSFDGGGRAATRFLVAQVGIPEGEIHLEDGSGLSRLNRASPGAIVRLLAYMSASDLAAPFFGSLPEAGNRRELSRMARTAAAGNLRAKTGTIDRVSALSGIVHSLNGEEILFSIVVNDVSSTFAAKRVEDQIGARLARFTRPDLLASSAPGSPTETSTTGTDRPQ